MIKFTWLFIVIGFSYLFSCKDNKIRSIKIGEEIANGKISADTTYDGLIKFYDVKSNKLIRECTYLHGILHGKRIDYYINGQIADKFFYENGKQNGYASVFDTNGNLLNKDFYYYDIKTGPSIDYLNGKISGYWFYSLNGDALFTLQYDSLKGKRITDTHSGYFFYHVNDFMDLTDSGFSEKKQEYFLYTPNPPKYNFDYSLVIVENGYNIKSTIKRFDNDLPWSTFSLNKNLDSTEKFALKLLIRDSINGGDIAMFKILK